MAMQRVTQQAVANSGESIFSLIALSSVAKVPEVALFLRATVSSR